MSKPKIEKPKERIRKALESLVARERITPEAMLAVVGIAEEVFEEWHSEVVEVLQGMVKDWEETMGDDDKSFYTLGIRRSIDIITAESAEEKLPILEKPDTPDSE